MHVRRFSSAPRDEFCRADYFLAAGLRSPAGRAGVIAVRLNLLPFEDALHHSGDTVMVVDREGVVILSSRRAWRYRVLEPLSREAGARLARTRQYADQPLLPLAPGMRIRPDTAEVRLPTEDGVRRFGITRRPVGPLGWQMLMLTDRAPAQQAALTSALATSGAAAFLLGGLLHLRLQRQRRADRAAAREALQRANDALEQRIQQRTADLTATNRELAAKVEALKRAEAILQETRDAAVQAGKLAVLGQMSAGMTHELNQPLGALRTLSDNAMLLLEQDRVDEVRENLRLIGELAERMGRIVTQLKLFARKDPATLAEVSLAAAIEHALLMVESRRSDVQADIRVFLPPGGVQVRADTVRLEQVLVNLLRNALDAVEQAAVRVIELRCEPQDRLVRLAVRDTGPGLGDEVLARLGEPFFTTKPPGRGRGLGLARTLALVETFGGRLQAGNLPEGGAEFLVFLEYA